MSRKSTPRKAALVRRWRIIEIARKGRHIADLPAMDADAAIRQAIELYSITDPHRQRRLVAQPIE
jgi:hypothetical protein